MTITTVASTNNNPPLDDPHPNLEAPPTTKKGEDDNKGNLLIVWLVVCFGAVGGILFGMDQANFAGVEHKSSFIDTFCNVETNSSGSWGTAATCRGGFDDTTGEKIIVPMGMTNFQAWGSSLIQLGAAAGALLVAPSITKKYGRRAGLASGCLVVLVAMIWCVLETRVFPFYISRWLTGIGIGYVGVVVGLGFAVCMECMNIYYSIWNLSIVLN